MDDGQKPNPAPRRARRKPNGGMPPPSPLKNSHVDTPAPLLCPGNASAAAEQIPNPASYSTAAELQRMQKGPLLMLPERTGGTVRTLYDLSRGRSVDVDLPEMAHQLCYGCFHGWLMAGNCLTGECFLLEPLSRKLLELPDISICIRTPHAALSSAPTESGCIVAAAFPGTLILCRPGASMWSVHRLDDYEHDALFGDCAFCQGKLYIVYGGGTNLFIVDDPPSAAAATSASRCAAVRRVEMGVASLPPQAPGVRRLGFLVESRGEMLLVAMTVAEGRLSCEIFRADLESATWVAAEEGLGDQTLFVGKGCSTSVTAGGGGVRSGRVYISHPEALGDEEGRNLAQAHGRWFWAEHVVGLGCPPMKRAPPVQPWELCWDASYWLMPTKKPATLPPPPASPPTPPSPTGVQV